MTNLMTVIHNTETGEIIERKMNAAEIAQLEKEKAQKLANQQAEIAKAAEKATAQAKLAALGLTTDDLKALGL